MNDKPNEKYWKKLPGTYWKKETNDRKNTDQTYLKQEKFLKNYFTKAAVRERKLKVLDFGCGYGRMLKVLSKINKIEGHGVDFNPSMIRTAKKELPNLPSNRLITLTNFKLPFPDKYFEYSFTVSVLIHNQLPEVKKIIKELVRVTKNQIVHIENRYYPRDILNNLAHDGCWYHNYFSLYKELDLFFIKYYSDLLPHGVYTIGLNNNEDFTNLIPHNVLFNKNQEYIYAEIIDYLNQINGPDIANLFKIRLDLLSEISNKNQQTALKQLEEENLQINDRLNRITNSKYYIGYKLYNLIKKKLLPLNTKHTKNETFYFQHVKGNFKNNRILGICHKDWHGIRTATLNQCSDVLYVKSIDTTTHIKLISKKITELGFKNIAINGLPDGIEKLIGYLAKRHPKIKIFLIWHGSFTQQSENQDHIWRFNLLKPYFKHIYKFGVVKRGDEKIYVKLGLKAEYIPNNVYPPKLKLTPKIYTDKLPVNVTIPAIFSWHKNNLNQILAASFIKNSKVHILNSPNLLYLEKIISKKITTHGFLSKHDFLYQLANSDVISYVSLTECYPMVPLESMSLGKPCIVGKTSEFLFENNSFLKDHLVVNNPEDIFEIKTKLEWILKNYQNVTEQIQAFMVPLLINNRKMILKFFDE